MSPYIGEMETWFIILVSLCISSILKSLFSLLCPSNPTGKVIAKLPPQPRTLPVIGNLLWLCKPLFELGPMIRSPKYGRIITLQIDPQPIIIVAAHSLAHQALIENGAAFANRPATVPQNQFLSGNQKDISSSAYGSTWRVLRRNIASQILHPSRIKSYSHARNRVLGILISRLKQHSGNGEAVLVVDHFQYTMFFLLVLMCFGDEVDENQVKEVETVQRRLVLNFDRLKIFSLWPRLGKIVFRKCWNEHLQILQSREDAFIHLIRAQRKVKQQKLSKVKDEEEKKAKEFVMSYADTLFDLHLPDENKKLDDGDMMSLCSEFLSGGTDTTMTALQWIMANLVKHPHIQAKLFAKINGVVETREEEIKEEALPKMPYLKAVILEGLRRHPPLHDLIPHAVTEDVTLDGYVVPKNATVNFLVAEMGRDPNVWEDPLEFKPERFMSSDGNGGKVFDITGSKEIKMMPFGARRRICPGYGLAMLHLEYFVANLVWCFEWTAVDGDDIDLSEKLEFTVVMKNPLRAHISPRVKQC